MGGRGSASNPNERLATLGVDCSETSDHTPNNLEGFRMMSQRERAWMGWLLLGALLGLVPAVGAQQAESEGSAPASEEAFVAARRPAAVPAEAQLAEARRIQQSGERISRRIQAMLDEARREKDIIRVTCLNDKLTQIDTNLRTLSDRISRFEAAASSGDTERRNHEFTVISVLGQKFRALEQEANQCIGQDVFETGATRVVVDIDPATPEEQPERLTIPVDDISIAEVPPPASDYL